MQTTAASGGTVSPGWTKQEWLDSHSSSLGFFGQAARMREHQGNPASSTHPQLSLPRNRSVPDKLPFSVYCIGALNWGKSDSRQGQSREENATYS